MKYIIDIPEDCLEDLNNIELNELNEGVVFHTICCVRNGIPLEEIRQIRPCMREPEQEGHEEYNKGWNDAIKEYLCNIDYFKENKQ